MAVVDAAGNVLMVGGDADDEDGSDGDADDGLVSPTRLNGHPGPAPRALLTVDELEQAIEAERSGQIGEPEGAAIEPPPPPVPPPLRLEPGLAFDMFVAVLRSVEPGARTAWIRRTLPELSRLAFENPAEGFAAPLRRAGPPPYRPPADPVAGLPATGEEAQQAFEAHVANAVRLAWEHSSAAGEAAGPSGGTQP